MRIFAAALFLGLPASTLAENLSGQASHCWNKAMLSSIASRGTILVEFKISEDGMMIPRSIRLLEARGADAATAKQIYESARRAILMCVDRQKNRAGQTIILRFGPDGVAIEEPAVTET